MNQPAMQMPTTIPVRSGALRAPVWADRYEVGEILGAGAMGTVFQGFDRLLGRPVAIKRIQPRLARCSTFVSALQREACAGVALSHPNIARTFDFHHDAEEALCFLVMERLHGRSLDRVIDEQPRPPVAWTLQIVAQTLAALAAAHDEGIIHRDVKPDNVMLERVVDDEGRPADQAKLCDFGIARVAGMPLYDDEGRPLTFHGVPCGTPGYMAPEQHAGHTLDHRVDIYAAGALLHEMITGERPFGVAPDPDDPMPPHRRLVMPSEVCPEIDPELERVILRATADDPEARYQSAREMRADVLRCLPAGMRVTYAPPLEHAAGQDEADEIFLLVDAEEADRESGVQLRVAHEDGGRAPSQPDRQAEPEIEIDETDAGPDPEIDETDAGPDPEIEESERAPRPELEPDPELDALQRKLASTPVWPSVLALLVGVAMAGAVLAPDIVVGLLKASFEHPAQWLPSIETLKEALHP